MPDAPQPPPATTALPPPRDAAAIRAWMAGNIAVLLKIDPAAVAVDASFADLGMDSLTAVTFAGDLGDWLGREVDPEALYEHPTISDLAAWLAQGR